MKQKNNYHMNIGGASILLVLAILALTVFAILSMHASYHELKMSEKTRDSVQDYYSVDSMAEEVFMNISEEIVKQQSAKEPLNIKQVCQAAGENVVANYDENSNILTYQVPMDYNKTLEVMLLLPENEADKVTVQSWKMVVDEQGDYGSGMEEIWDGILEE